MAVGYPLIHMVGGWGFSLEVGCICCLVSVDNIVVLDCIIVV